MIRSPTVLCVYRQMNQRLPEPPAPSGSHKLAAAALCLGGCAALLFQPLAFAGPSGQPQTKPEGQESPVKLKSQLIELRAVVTNKQGQPVNDLKKEHFEVLENGRPQDVSFFSAESVGGGGNRTSAAPVPTRPILPSNPASLSTQPPARTFVIFADTLTMEQGNLLRAKSALRKFVDERITDRDMTALVATSGSSGLNGRFTRDKKVLHYVIDLLRSTQLSPISLFTPYLAYSIVQGDPQALGVGLMIRRLEEYNPYIKPEEVKAHARQIMESSFYQRKTILAMLGQVVDRLAGTPGQRIVAVLSDGISIKESLGGNSLGDLSEVTTRAARTGVVLYTINTRGLQDAVSATVRPRLIYGPEAAVLKGYMTDGDNDLKDGLRTLAEDTGGEALINTNDIAGSLRKTLDSNSSYYALAYYPEDAGDKRFRRITVRIKDHPDYHVRTQRGYVPFKPKKASASRQSGSAQDRLLKAMVEPLPASGIGVETWADYFGRDGEKGQVYLHTHVIGSNLHYTEDADRLKFKFTLAVLVFDPTGNAVSREVRSHEGDIKAERGEAVSRAGFFQTIQLSLKPGVYQVRAGVTDEVAETTGTSITWLTVPELGHKSIALSGVLLGNNLLEGRSDAIPQPLVVADESNRKQPVKVFKLGDVVSYVFKIYNAPPEKDGSVPLEMKVDFLKDEQVFTQSSWRPVEQREVSRDESSIELGGGFKLDGIQPGVYSLRVTVRDLGSSNTAQSETPFAVEPK
jgi:VWFA-related protein